MSREPLRLALVTAPAQLPVSLNEAKDWIDIADSETAFDARIQGLIVNATDEAEKFLGRALITQTWRLNRDNWPSVFSRKNEPWWDGVRQGAISELRSPARELELPRPPLQSVTSVTTYNDSDTATVFATSNYFVDSDSEPGRIVLRNTAAVPVIDRVANGLEVVFVAGYGDDPGDVPEPIRQGILMTVAWAYTNRGDCEEGSTNSGARGRWQNYRMMRIG